MEGEKLEIRERDFDNGRGRHGGERERKYASGGAGALHIIGNYYTKYVLVVFFTSNC